MTVRRNAPVLRRDDPTEDPLIGNIKVTRQDWSMSPWMC